MSLVICFSYATTICFLPVILLEPCLTLSRMVSPVLGISVNAGTALSLITVTMITWGISRQKRS